MISDRDRQVRADPPAEASCEDGRRASKDDGPGRSPFEARGRFEVSKKIREEYENGRDYYRLHGTKIRLPDDPKRWPNPSALTWHNDNRFKG